MSGTQRMSPICIKPNRADVKTRMKGAIANAMERLNYAYERLEEGHDQDLEGASVWVSAAIDHACKARQSYRELRDWEKDTVDV